MTMQIFGRGASAITLGSALLVAAIPAVAQATKKAAAGPARAAAASGPKAELVALLVGKPSPGDKNPGMMGGRAMRMGRMDREGTLLTFVLQLPDKQAVGFDEKASKLTAFKDDKGTDLAKAGPKAAASPFGNPGFGGMGPGAEPPLTCQVDNEGHRVTLDVFGPRTPAAGAGKITVKADLVLKIGAVEKTAEQKELLLTAGSKLTAGPVPMTVEDNKAFNFGGLGGPGGPQTTLTLASRQPTSAIKALAFLDADGKPIGSQVLAQMDGAAFGNPGSFQTTYSLDKKVERVGVKVTYYEKIESLTVPVAIEAGVGF